jgi:hypothetical protein
MSTASAPALLEISVLDQIYAWEAYSVSPPNDGPVLRSRQEKDLCFQPPGNTMDRWLDLSA